MGLKQPTPRKGTETSICAALLIQFMKQPTPRKGTETLRPNGANISPRKQPTPRKGTETPSQSLEIHSLAAETTHTPQGDGNPAPRRYVPRRTGNNPHPARGRKLLYFRDWHSRLSKQPTPRKGTENHLCSHCRNCWRNHSHPRQGTTDKKRSVRHLESRKRARQLRLSAARHR